MSIHAEIQRLFLHPNTLWSKHIGGHQPIPQRAFLQESDIVQHLEGAYTVSVQLLNPQTRGVKAFAIDIDDHAGNLDDCLLTAKRIKQVADSYGLKTYLEFSGRRGFHVWCFVRGIVDAFVARRAALYICEQVGVTGLEVFPFGDSLQIDTKEDGSVSWSGSAYKPIKLPLGKHQEGSWSCFIDWDSPGADDLRVLDAPQFFQKVKTNEPEPIREIASLHHEHGVSQNVNHEYDFSAITSRGTPPKCIQYLIEFGVPHDMEYNTSSVIVARYANSAGLSDTEAQQLAALIAASTEKQNPPHPTSKNLRAKLQDIAGVLRTARRKREQYGWNCFSIFRSKDLIESGGCDSTQCPLYPHDKSDFEDQQETGADYSIEQDIICFMYHYGDAVLEFANIENVHLEGFISKVLLREGSDQRVPIYRWLFEIFQSLIGRSMDITPGTVLREFDTQKMYEPYLPHVTKVAEKVLATIHETRACGIETFQAQIEFVQERGLRIYTKRELADASLALNTMAGTGQIISTVEAVRGRVLENDLSAKAQQFVQNLPRFFDNLSKRKDIVIETQDAPLNALFSGGLRPALYFLAGQPGAGKTTWALDLCKFVAESKIPTLLLEYEMSQEELYVHMLSAMTGYDSAKIDNIDTSTQDGASMLEELERCTWWMYENLGCLNILECDPNVDTVYRIRSHIHRWRQRIRRLNGNSGEKRFLAVIDSVQHVITGNQTIDKDEVRMASWVGSELARIARPADANTVIIGIAEITKESLGEMIKTGHVDLGTLRGSFRMAHSAHVVAILKTGTIKGGKDQLDLITDDDDAIRRIRFDYPITNQAVHSFVVMDIIKNRSGKTGKALFFHEKPQHRLKSIALGKYLSTEYVATQQQTTDETMRDEECL